MHVCLCDGCTGFRHIEQLIMHMLPGIHDSTGPDDNHHSVSRENTKNDPRDMKKLRNFPKSLFQIKQSSCYGIYNNQVEPRLLLLLLHTGMKCVNLCCSGIDSPRSVDQYSQTDMAGCPRSGSPLLPERGR